MHRARRIDEVKSVKDVVAVLGSHSWVLTQVEQYGEPKKRGGEAGVIATMKCRVCNTECSIVIVPPSLIGAM